MTETEIREAWLRWMHRRDVEADLDTIMELAAALVIDRLKYSPPDAGWDREELIAAIPRAWLHAGLIHLHELAQDDAGGSRETQLFQRAMGNWHMRRSIDGGPAIMRAC